MSNTDFEEPDDGQQVDELPADVEESGDEGAEAVEADAEGADAQDDEGAVEAVAQPARRPSRSEARIQSLRSGLEAERQNRERLERELADVRQQVSRPKQESPEEEAARLALMTPEERVDYKLAKAERANAQNAQMMQFQMAEATDKAAFQGMSRVDPLVARYATQVEQELTRIRARGLNLPREEILHNILGREALAKRSKTGAVKAAGARTVRRQTTAPGSGKADVAADRGRSADTPAKRLEGVQI